MSMYKVNFNRLLECSYIDKDSPFEWPGASPVYVDDVMEVYHSGVAGYSTPWGDTYKFSPKNVWSAEKHILRIVYLMNHPELLNGIDVDNICIEGVILPACSIVDGWHRIVAGICLDIEEVYIDYGGRLDVLDYLIGKTDYKDFEVF